MKLPALLITLGLLTGTAAALSFPPLTSVSRTAGTDPVYIALSEGGQRFPAEEPAKNGAGIILLQS